jgi:hypothetical protein
MDFEEDTGMAPYSIDVEINPRSTRKTESDVMDGNSNATYGFDTEGVLIRKIKNRDGAA